MCVWSGDELITCQSLKQHSWNAVEAVSTNRIPVGSIYGSVEQVMISVVPNMELKPPKPQFH